jgi:SNF2 family DNA or RNA helicase
MSIPYAPHQYQINGIQLIAGRANGALLLDPGLGKTSMSLGAFLVMKEAGAVSRMLVIAPLRPARLVWPAEVAKWADFAHLRVSLVLGTAKQRQAALSADADIYVVNCDNTAWLFEPEQWALFGDRAPEMLVVDESTRFKNPTSVRFKALRDHLGKFARRYILTGTPTPQSIEDLFSQAYICDEGAALGKYITRFRREFCTAENIRIGGGRVIQKWHPQADAAERVYQRVNGMALRLKAEDHLTMPKLVDNRIEVELPAAARVQYDKLEKDLFLATGGGATMAPANAAACVMKLRQLVNGMAYAVDEDRQALSVAIHTAKLDALAALVEEQQGTPLLVAVSFLHEVEAIRAALGDASIPYLGGGVSAAQADDIVTRWNRGELPVLLAHPSSVAHGLNLQAGGHCVAWFGLTWNLEEYEQLNRRVYRQGQTKTVVIHHIIARDTVDGDILTALQTKSSAQQAILTALKGKA